jgi:hypothetical protein
MNEHDDLHLSDLIGTAASRYQPASDLRSRIDRRAGQQRRRAHVSMTMAVLLVVAVAVSSLAYRSQQSGDRTSDMASPVTTPETVVDPGSSIAPSPGSHAFEWNIRTLELRAQELRIEVGGKVFVADASNFELTSEVGDTNRDQTFEVKWQEHGVEMRMSIAFTSDGTDWWADEIRTYDGNAPGAWVTYRGEFFRSPLGQPFVGDLHLPADATSHDGTGSLTLTGLRVQAFVPDVPCTEDHVTADILFPEASSVPEGGPNVAATVRLQKGLCAVFEASPYTFTWEVDDPTIVEVTPACAAGTSGPTCQTAELKLLRDGETTLRVTVRDASGATVAEGSLFIAKGSLSWPTAPSVP